VNVPSELVVFIKEQMAEFKKLYFSIEKKSHGMMINKLLPIISFFLSKIGMLKPLPGIPNPY